jgi:hypothetical protein
LINKLLQRARLGFDTASDLRPATIGSVSVGKPDGPQTQLLLTTKDRRIWVNQRPVGDVAQDVMAVLRKIMENPTKLWKYSELVDRPEGYSPKQHQDLVKEIMDKLPSEVRQLFERNPGGHRGGRRLKDGIKIRVE